MAYVSPTQAYQAAAAQTGIIKGEIARYIARTCPYIPMFNRGTFDLNKGRTYRHVVQEAPFVAGSLVRPSFTTNATLSSVCEPAPSTDKFGAKEFNVVLATLSGSSDPICIKEARAAFESAFLNGVRSIKEVIRKQVNADCRNQAIFGGGTKFIMHSSGFDYGVTGSILTPDVNFPQTSTALPDLPITFSALKQLAGYMEDNLQVNPFPGSMGEMYIGAFGLEATDYMRDLEGLNLDIRAIVQGGFTDGKKMIKDYEFSGPHRGIGFARDPQPLRAISFAELATSRFSSLETAPSVACTTVVDAGTLTTYLAGDNQLRLQGLVPGYSNLVLVEPEIGVASTTGVAGRPNPAWVKAKYELGLFAGMNAYKRLVPPRYGGEGEIKFPDQLTPETLKFINPTTPTTNKFGHNGWLIYEIERAFEPTYPQAFAGVIYLRNPFV